MSLSFLIENSHETCDVETFIHCLVLTSTTPRLGPDRISTSAGLRSSVFLLVNHFFLFVLYGSLSFCFVKVTVLFVIILNKCN